ncbi:bromodomain-containing protein 3-like [Copidosoma floridanum]|uniref:bromodomain-containing protein 3-like n=1 Tax=Copidosoma floridanum TaxID=29053 RepID=UPI0006C9802E|nr:bromodomain-containing protein 3-like [Copidosoma floridanum]
MHHQKQSMLPPRAAPHQEPNEVSMAIQSTIPNLPRIEVARVSRRASTKYHQSLSLSPSSGVKKKSACRKKTQLDLERDRLQRWRRNFCLKHPHFPSVELHGKYVLSSAMTMCSEILEELLSKENVRYAWPFYGPLRMLNRKLPSNHPSVTNPVNLLSIKSNFERGSYESSADYIRDMRRMFTNCYRCHADATEIVKRAQCLQSIFELKIAGLPDDSVEVDLTSKSNKYWVKVLNAVSRRYKEFNDKVREFEDQYCNDRDTSTSSSDSSDSSDSSESSSSDTETNDPEQWRMEGATYTRTSVAGTGSLEKLPSTQLAPSYIGFDYLPILPPPRPISPLFDYVDSFGYPYPMELASYTHPSSQHPASGTQPSNNYYNWPSGN